MTPKGELRQARLAAVEAGRAWNQNHLDNPDEWNDRGKPKKAKRRSTKAELVSRRNASYSEQQGRYLDAGPGGWDGDR